MLADKAYDADRIRELIQDQGTTPSIPPKSNRRWKPCFSKRLYRERNLIERFFSNFMNYASLAVAGADGVGGVAKVDLGGGIDVVNASMAGQSTYFSYEADGAHLRYLSASSSHTVVVENSEKFVGSRYNDRIVINDISNLSELEIDGQEGDDLFVINAKTDEIRWVMSDDCGNDIVETNGKLDIDHRLVVDFEDIGSVSVIFDLESATWISGDPDVGLFDIFGDLTYIIGESSLTVRDVHLKAFASGAVFNPNYLLSVEGEGLGFGSTFWDVTTFRQNSYSDFDSFSII